MERDCDVIIVGGGGAGLAAAIMATEAGADVMIIEADTKLGGATMLAGGVFYAAGTSVQRARGIEDTADALYEYLMNVNQWEMSPELIRIYADECGPSLEWLIEHGATFPPDWLTCSGCESVPRGHASDGAGATVAATLYNAAGALDISTALDTRVEGFLVEDGRVVGVHAGGTEVRAPSVVVTTGGFGNNLDLVKKWWPTVGVHGDRVWAVHRDAPFILGDGLLMGEAIGAEIVGYDHGLILPHSGFVKEHESELPPWVMLVNKQGRRFMDERAPYSVSGNLLNQQPDQVAWAIFDEEALTIGGNDKRYVDPYNIGWIRSSWGEEDIRDRTARGLIKSADSVEQLATMIGVDPEAVGITIERYNRDADQGVDTAFRKVADRTFPVRKPPFYAIEVRATLIGLTSTGLNIDGECRVLDRRGAPIGGLYAAGEVLGCVQGYTYGGGGMSIGAAVVYGRRAGIHAAEHARVPEHAA